MCVSSEHTGLPIAKEMQCSNAGLRYAERGSHIDRFAPKTACPEIMHLKIETADSYQTNFHIALIHHQREIESDSSNVKASAPTQTDSIEVLGRRKGKIEDQNCRKIDVYAITSATTTGPKLQKVISDLSRTLRVPQGPSIKRNGIGWAHQYGGTSLKNEWSTKKVRCRDGPGIEGQGWSQFRFSLFPR